MFGAINFILYIGGAFRAREFGGEIKMPDSEYSMSFSLQRPAVEKEEDAMNLKLTDVMKAGIIPSFVEFSKLQEKYDWPITTYAGGILTRAEYICSPERLVKWIIEKPDMAHHLCRLTANLFIEMYRHWVDLFSSGSIICINGSPV
jgi:uroporphyrinogen-III decarboxylase